MGSVAERFSKVVLKALKAFFLIIYSISFHDLYLSHEEEKRMKTKKGL
jgi:hypothetical protein